MKYLFAFVTAVALTIGIKNEEAYPLFFGIFLALGYIDIVIRDIFGKY
jgi:hypothetical protein